MVYVETLGTHVYLVEFGLSLHVVFAREPAEHDGPIINEYGLQKL